MNKLSGLGITVLVFSVWMSIWGSSKHDEIGMWISLVVAVLGGIVLIASLPMK